MFDLFEICLQDLDISINEWAVVFFLNEIEAGVIRGSHFGWSFHGGCPFWCLFAGIDRLGAGRMGLAEIDFAFEIEKSCSIRSGQIEWRIGTELS